MRGTSITQPGYQAACWVRIVGLRSADEPQLVIESRWVAMPEGWFFMDFQDFLMVFARGKWSQQPRRQCATLQQHLW